MSYTVPCSLVCGISDVLEGVVYQASECHCSYTFHSQSWWTPLFLLVPSTPLFLQVPNTGLVSITLPAAFVYRVSDYHCSCRFNPLSHWTLQQCLNIYPCMCNHIWVRIICQNAVIHAFCYIPIVHCFSYALNWDLSILSPRRDVRKLKKEK